MEFKKDIERMVDVAYQVVIEGEGIYSDFEYHEVEATHVEIDSFIQSLDQELIAKWYKKLEKKVAKDVIENSECYSIDAANNLEWKDVSVQEWMENYFSNKIVKAYKKAEKNGQTKKKYSYSVSTNTIWTSFDCGEVYAYNKEEARELAEQQLEKDFALANKVLRENTKGFEVNYCSSEIEIKEEK